MLTTHSYYVYCSTKNRHRKMSYANELPYAVYKDIRDDAITHTFLYDGVFNFTTDRLISRISEDILQKLGFERKVDYNWNSDFERWVKKVGESKLELYYTFKKDSKPWHISLRDKNDKAEFMGYVGTVEDMRDFCQFSGIDYDIRCACAENLN